MRTVTTAPSDSQLTTKDEHARAAGRAATISSTAAAAAAAQLDAWLRRMAAGAVRSAREGYTAGCRQGEAC